MAGARASKERRSEAVYATLAGIASLGMAASIAVSPLMGVAVAAGAAALCVALFAPAGLVLAWLGTATTIPYWFDIKIGPLPALTPDRALLAVLLSVLACRWLLRRQTLLPLGRLELLMAWFIIFAAASAVAGGGSRQTNLIVKNPGGSLNLDLIFLALGYGIPFVGFLLAKNLLHRENHIRWLLGTFIVAGVFVALTGVLQDGFGITVFTPTRIAVSHQGRATGTMTSAQEFGLIVGTSLLTAAVCFLRSRYVPERLFLAVAMVIMAAGIGLNRTRVIWFGLVVGIGIATLYESALRKRMIAAVLASTVSLAAAWPLIADTQFVQGRVLDLVPVYHRVVTAATALNMFAHSPLVGHGFGRYTYDSEKWPYITGIGGLSPYYALDIGVPHNEYLHILVLLGLAGFVPYVAMLTLAWRTAARHYRECVDLPGPRRDIALIFLSAFALYLTTSATADSMFSGAANLQIYSLLGAVDGLRARESGIA